MRSMPKHGPAVQEHDENEQRYVDGRQVVGEPLGQIQLGDGSRLGAQRLSQLGQRTPESVRSEQSALAEDDARSDGRPPIGSAGQAGVQQVCHT